MRKLLIAVLAILCLVGCTVVNEPDAIEPTMYIVSGHYYACGEVITEDGNLWGYDGGTSDYDNEPVNVLFDDMGTPDNIYDDEIVGLVGR